MELILWRHADAEDGYPDAARALTSRGREQAEKMGDWLARRLPRGALILASPAVRAQQTAEFIGRAFRTEPRVGTSASPQDILAAAGWGDQPGTAVVVGHQPTLGRVACELCTGQPGEWPFAKAAVWWFAHDAHGVMVRAVLAPELA